MPRPSKTVDASRGEDADLLEEIRTRFDYALKEWDETRIEADTDMRYVSGNRGLTRTSRHGTKPADRISRWMNSASTSTR